MTSLADTAELLRLYFIQQRSVNLPGIGSFEMNRIPARVDHATGSIEAPSYTILYDSLNDIPSKEMFSYVSRKRSISEWESIGVVNNFSMALNDHLKKGQKFEWGGMGTLEHNSSGQLVFYPGITRYDFHPDLTSIPQTGIIHGHAAPGEYNEALYGSGEQGTVEASASWWVSAAVIAAVALMMIFFSLVNSEYKLNGARQTKLVPAYAPLQYESKTAD
jgi:nucleoid DNA-binding protein